MGPGWRCRQYGLSYGSLPLTRPYMPKVAITSPMTKLNRTFWIRKARMLAEESSTARLAKPLSTNSVPTVMLTVEAVLPPITVPVISTKATSTDTRLSRPLLERPAIGSPSVLKKESPSARPRQPKTSRAVPQSPAPTR